MQPPPLRLLLILLVLLLLLQIILIILSSRLMLTRQHVAVKVVLCLLGAPRRRLGQQGVLDALPQLLPELGVGAQAGLEGLLGLCLCCWCRVVVWCLRVGGGGGGAG